MNTPLKRIRDQLGVYKLAEQECDKYEKQKRGTLERDQVGINDFEEDSMEEELLSRL